MVNPFKEVDWNPDVAGRRSFAKSLVIGFPCVALAFLLILRVKNGAWEPELPLRIGLIGAAVGAVLYALPMLARPFYLVWYAVACGIGLVIGNVLLGMVFYVFVTGIALVMRLLGRDPLNRRLDRSAATYWREAEQPSDPRRYYSQF